MARAGGNRRAVARLLAVAVVVLGLCPSVAWAHAQLLSTSPADNAVVARAPAVASFTFGESVGIDGEAVRVFDRAGRRVDTGGTFHPGGRGATVGVHLRSGLADGTYTATYRVVSADTHIVTGGVVFSIGARSAAATAATAANLTRLLARQRSGPVSDTAFVATRGVQYAAIGIAVGLFAFLALIWSVALQRAGPAPDVWRTASTRYLRRVRLILACCCVAGAVSALAGLALQGAEARGIEVWRALDTTTVNDVLPTRFGIVWAAGLVAWLLALGVLAAPLARRWTVGLIPQPATLGATGVVLPSARARWPLAAVAAPLAALLALPALAGHATIQHPVWLFAPVNVLHVTAMSVWLGGLVGLLTGALTLPSGDAGDPAVGTRALGAALIRFSPIALGCVVVLIATGVVQALIEVSAWSQLVDTGYGRAIVVKCAALAVLIALGARQRSRTIPAVTAAMAANAPPASPARLLRQTLGAELAMLVVVLAAVGSLAGSAPAREQTMGNGTAVGGMSGTGATAGPAMPSRPGAPARAVSRIGAARLAVRVAPARVGANRIALTLTKPRTGRPFTATKQLTVTATLRRRGIGPLTLHARRVAAGRYLMTRAVLGAAGTWTLTILDRTSAFDEAQRAIRVPIH